ncbi:MAG: aminotransferase class I/II-fold pyridoxal phosphate-dependent enzyme [Flavobacteriaceae bacterium]|nr:aminotransferase class I/II-fold pyridoxal phosphate-dependent enzyme [Flavobacteriaceae bacterium]
MNHISKLPNTGTTIFSSMSKLAQEHNAINLSQGFPNFESDPKLIALVAKAMKNGYNQYAPMLGVQSLREEIAAKFQKLYASSYNPSNEIVVTAGATQAIFTVISAFVRANDEVIVLKPAYDCYEPAIELQGGKVVPIQLKYPNYRVDWKQVEGAITSKTKMIIVNTPQNPSGTIFSKEDMMELERITNNTEIIVLSDEVYEHMIYDGKQHQSACLFPTLKERSFITASFGKTFHNTGWKMGYCCGPEVLMKEFVKVHQFNVFAVNHPVQVALAEYLQDEKKYLDLPNFFQRKRDLFLNAIDPSRFEWVPTEATYFQSLNFSKISSENDVDFAKKLTKEFGIASIPLSVFNENQLDFKALRFCFAKTDETLIQAAEILNGL